MPESSHYIQKRAPKVKVSKSCGSGFNDAFISNGIIS